jgi:AraC-like DNA-binding protein
MLGDAGQALRYYAPSAPLVRYITNIFVWTGERTAFTAWMPAIEGQIFICLGGSVTVRFAHGPDFPVDRPMLVGPMAGTMHMDTGPALVAVGAGMTAAGYLRLIGADATGVIDRTTDLGGLWGDQTVQQLRQRLIDLTCHDARAALLGRWLQRRLVWREAADDWRALALDRWLARGATSLDALCRDLSLSHRQAARLAATMHGMSPKSLAMRERALRAARALAASGRGTASDHQYADQSHMIRDFKRFIGSTPRHFVETPVARHVFEDPERAGTSIAIIGG